jgi:hypothetical protein
MLESKVDEFVGKAKNQKGKICTQIEILIENFEVKFIFYIFCIFIEFNNC